MPLRDSCASLPRISRQRLSCSGVKVAAMSNVAKVEFVEVFQRLFLFFAERLLDQLAGRVSVQAPALAKVFCDVPFLPRAEAAKGPPQEYECSLELSVVEGADVVRQLLPQRLPGQQGITIALGQALKPAGPKVRRHA